MDYAPLRSHRPESLAPVLRFSLSIGVHVAFPGRSPWPVGPCAWCAFEARTYPPPGFACAVLLGEMA